MLVESLGEEHLVGRFFDLSSSLVLLFPPITALATQLTGFAGILSGKYPSIIK